MLSQSQLHTAACKIIHPPKCATCQFRKQKQHPSPGKESSVIKDHDGVLKKDHLLPGQCVSVDHFVCNTKGRLYMSQGKTSPNNMYDGGCIYFDHALGFIHCEHQVNLTTHEMLQAKEHFEWMCHDYGVIPQTYMSDNGKPFVSRDYEHHLATFKQIQNFAGVGAHHHNGMAECAIQMIMSIARTMLARSSQPFLQTNHSSCPHLYQENGFFMPLVFKASNSDPDTLTFDEAMANTVNCQGWLEAAVNEISALEAKGTWLEVNILQAESKILPGTWVFCHKCMPDGMVSKLKARYCVHGDLQEGKFDTHAQVISWSSIRVFLVLSITLKWHMCTIDFSNAFVQAKLDAPVWIHLPHGFKSEHRYKKTCLCLKKSCYGLLVAPRLWSQHLLSTLKKEGFIASKYDSCLLIKPNMLIVLYVNDAGVCAKNEHNIGELIHRLTKRGFELTREGSFSEFLGIKFVHDKETGTITAMQHGLIKNILAATSMEDCNPNWVPATPTALGIDPDGEPMDEEWSYPSIIGMLLYLSTNTRPDITFAVSQVARFNHSPKKSHVTAIKMIIRYLKCTINKGTIIHPTGTLQLDCWVDATFRNLYHIDLDHKPSATKSRTGYIITLGGCPLLWKSQLQSTIALSTQEGEYCTLSQAMRTLIPIRAILLEISSTLSLPPSMTASICSQVFEDNNGALLLAVNQCITSRTKH